METVDPIKVFLNDPRVRHTKGVDDSFSFLYLGVVRHSKQGQRGEALKYVKDFQEKAKQEFGMDLSRPLVEVE